MIKKALVTGVIVTAIGATVALANFNFMQKSDVETENFAERKVHLPDLQFLNHEGSQVSFKDAVKPGGLVVISFNYTTCESICPIANQIMALVDQALANHEGRPVKLISITIDPSTDTPAKLKKARTDFSPSDRWVWLTGQKREIDAILSAFDAAVYDIELHDPIFLIGDPESGVFVKSLSMPESAELMAVIERFGA